MINFFFLRGLSYLIFGFPENKIYLREINFIFLKSQFLLVENSFIQYMYICICSMIMLLIVTQMSKEMSKFVFSSKGAMCHEKVNIHMGCDFMLFIIHQRDMDVCCFKDVL